MSEKNEELIVAQDTRQLQVIEGELSPEQVKNQIQKIQKMLKEVMLENQHYGLIPGCGPKPTLLKPGAEKLCMLFKLAPKYEIQQTEFAGDHREYRVLTSLHHIPTGNFVGSGVGTCSTKESKYRYRDAKRHCPVCGNDTIIKGKEEYGGGWLCFKKTGGCGEKFHINEESIVNQAIGKVENEDPADQYNTCLKIGKKRSLVDATITATAASDIFAQDLEDLPKTQVTPQAPPKVTPKAAPKAPPVATETRSEKMQGIKDVGATEVTKKMIIEKLNTKDLDKAEAKKFLAYVGSRKLARSYVYHNMEHVLDEWWTLEQSLPPEDDIPLSSNDLPDADDLFGKPL